MEESKVTASAVISFAKKLEEASSKFYNRLAEKFMENRETFLSFARESKKNKTLVTRTYQETITDALEAGFSFKEINLNDCIVETVLAEKTSHSNAIKMAVQLEEKSSEFYFIMAQQSKSLLATISNAFRKVAEKRNNRKLKLKSLLNDYH